jgi:hypothetical protein
LSFRTVIGTFRHYYCNLDGMQDTSFQSTNQVYTVTILSIWRFLFAIIGVSGLFLVLFVFFGTHIPAWLLKPMLIIAIIGGLYRMKGLITQNVQITIKTDGLYFEKKLTKWGSVRNDDEIILWAEIRGWHLEYGHTSEKTVSPPSFMLYLIDNTYRSLALANETDIKPIIEHLTRMKAHLGDFRGDFDPEKYGKLLTLCNSLLIIGWIFWTSTAVLAILIAAKVAGDALWTMLGILSLFSVISIVILQFQLSKKRKMEQ